MQSTNLYTQLPQTVVSYFGQLQKGSRYQDRVFRLTFKGKKSEDAKCGAGYTAVKRTTRAIPVIILQKKIPTNVESFTLTAKLTAVSENVSFLRRVCVENEVTDIHKFYRREIRFIRKFSASIS